MNNALKALLYFLLNKHIIGAKHFPEKKLIRSKTKYLKPPEQKEFEKEYKELLKQEFIQRFKKRTGKGSEWHISLNPRTLKEVYKHLQ